MDADEKSRRLLGVVQGYAQVVMALPPHEREKKLREFRDQSLDDAKSHGLDDVSAKEWAHKMDDWVRALVRIIEPRGGSTGGTA
jgi:hypothetical protein